MNQHTTNPDYQYRGATLTTEEQEKAQAEKDTHIEDVTHVNYRGAEDDIQLNKPAEKHTLHVQYRGAETDIEV